VLFPVPDRPTTSVNPFLGSARSTPSKTVFPAPAGAYPSPRIETYDDEGVVEPSSANATTRRLPPCPFLRCARAAADDDDDEDEDEDDRATKGATTTALAGPIADATARRAVAPSLSLCGFSGSPSLFDGS